MTVGYREDNRGSESIEQIVEIVRSAEQLMAESGRFGFGDGFVVFQSAGCQNLMQGFPSYGPVLAVWLDKDTRHIPKYLSHDHEAWARAVLLRPLLKQVNSHVRIGNDDGRSTAKPYCVDGAILARPFLELDPWMPLRDIKLVSNEW